MRITKEKREYVVKNITIKEWEITVDTTESASRMAVKHDGKRICENVHSFTFCWRPILLSNHVWVETIKESSHEQN